MKSLFALLGVVFLALITGGVYYKVRKAESRQSDWQRLKRVPSNIVDYFKALFAAKPTQATEQRAA